MVTGAFKEREQALENEFFYRVDKRLQDDLRKTMQNQASRDALAQATGLDDALVAELVEHGFSTESLAALAIAPLVLVAWADHSVDEKERRTVLLGLMSQRLDDNSLARRLVEEWLNAEPSPDLFVTWKHYTTAVCQTLTTDARDALRNDILKHATDVARASGSVLGYGRVSKAEKEILDKIETCFDR